MTDYTYLIGTDANNNNAEGWYRVDGDTLEIFAHEKIVMDRNGSTFVKQPGELVRAITLQEGDNPRAIAFRILRDHRLARGGHHGATGRLQYPDQGWF
jgi:hypothetical protein